jgi:hypothetical protein
VCIKFEARSCKVFAVEEQYEVQILSVCLSVALVIQHAISMRRVILSSVACSVLLHFPHYLTNGTTFGEKNVMNIKFVLWFSLQLTCMSETFFIPRRIQSDIITVRMHLCQVPVILWYPRSRVRTRPKPSDFSCDKIHSIPSFGR